MAVARKSGQRIRSGLYAAAALTSTYEVRQLAIQADQGLSNPWAINSRESNPPKPARITGNADLSKSADGFYSADWVMDFMTFGMFGHWLSSFLPGNVDSANVTIMTYDDQDVAVYLQCLIHRPRPGEGMTAIQGGWAAVKWEFRAGIVIT